MQRHFATALKTLTAAFVLSACASTGGTGTTSEASPLSRGGSKARNPVVAVVNGIEIRLSQVDATLTGELKQMELRYLEELYNLRSEALRGQVRQALLESEAKRVGVSTEDLLREEVTKKAFEGLDEAARAFFQENKEDFGDATFEEVEENLSRLLFQYRAAELEEAYFEGLASRAKVSLSLQPPRTELNTEGPRLGTGKVEIVIFSDFECPYCVNLHKSLKEVVAARKDQVSLIFRHFPLNFHEAAKPAHMMAACADEQGLFWKAHDHFFDSQDLSQEGLVTALTQAPGFSEVKLNECLQQGRGAAIMARDMAYAAELGVQGTPTFFINGLRLQGAREASELLQFIDAELAR